MFGHGRTDNLWHLVTSTEKDTSATACKRTVKCSEYVASSHWRDVKQTVSTLRPGESPKLCAECCPE